MEVGADAAPGGPAPDKLLKRIAQGDHGAFTELVEAHDADMVRLSFLISGDIEVARDATQNAWHKLWSKPPTLRDEAKLGPWLLSVAANEARQMMRRRRTGRVRELQSVGRSPAEGTSDIRIDLESALRGLDPSERELLGLRYLLGWSSEEIGRHIGLSAEGVRSRLHRLLQRMRADFGDE